MINDFDRLRHSARSSAIATAGRRMISLVAAAWETSAVGRWSGAAQAAFTRATPAARLRWWATTIGVAAAAHLVLRAFMSSTVRPAVPASFYIVIAVASALIAWRADAFYRAWYDSRLAGSMRSSGNDRN